MALQVTALTCEYQQEAKGVNRQQAVFGWKLLSEKQGAYQTAYRIVVTDEAGEPVWDSGRIRSDRQFGIEMDSPKKMLPMSRYFFKVMVWDEEELASEWESSWFLTGFFKVSQWKAQWFIVWYGDVHFYRNEFEVRDTDKILYAYLFLGSVGEKVNSSVALLNGERLGEMANFPGATEYFRAMYTCVDVKSRLKEGKNALGLMAANTSSLILKIRYRDGSEQYVGASRSGWKTQVRGPYDAIGYMEPIARGRFEEYDARKAFPGWTEPGFDDSGWTYEPDPLPIDFGFLFLQPQYCITKKQKEYAPVKIIRYPDYWFVDFGTNMAGFVSLRLRGKAGETVEIRYAEKLNGDCTEAEFTTWNPCYLKYTFATDEPEPYTPCFMHTSFRCVEIRGYSGELDGDSIRAISIHSDVLNHSRFECSDPTINLLNRVARKSFLSNLVNIPTDCPERERRGWTADTYSVSEAECVNFNMLTFFYQWMESMRDCQRGNGWISVELPISTDNSVDLDWPAAAVLIPYDVYMQYGDRRFIRRFYPVMKNWVDLLAEICDDDFSLCDSFLSYKDWLAIEPATSGYISMAYFYRCAELFSTLAAAVGKEEDAAGYGHLAEEIRRSINQKYLHVSESEVFYDNGCQSADAHALFFQICPPEYRQRVTDHLTRNIRQKKASTSGFMGTMCLMQALSRNGRADVALSLLKNRNMGGWLYLIEECNATTFPERYNEEGSQNHAFLGSSPGLWIYKYLVGIQPLEPGYRRVRIQPYIPEDMEYASATVETLYGDLSAGWERKDGKIRLKGSLPPNVTGVVEWNGRSVSVGSGRYELDFPLPV